MALALMLVAVPVTVASECLDCEPDVSLAIDLNAGIGEAWMAATFTNHGAGDASFDATFYVDGSPTATFTGIHLAPGAATTVDAHWEGTPGEHLFTVEGSHNGTAHAWHEQWFWVEEQPHGGSHDSTPPSDPGTEDPTTGDDHRWPVAEWCEGDLYYKEYEYSDGRREVEQYGHCERWPVAEWCDHGEFYKEYEYQDGSRHVEANGPCDDGTGGYGGHDDYYDPGHEPYQDPYGCSNGTWWDHYLAECVSQADQELLNSFWQCTDQVHRGAAEFQKEADIAARDARHERYALEQEAREREMSGDYDGAREIWDQVQRLDWEEQRRWHQFDQHLAEGLAACIDDHSAQASAIGAGYLIPEFQSQQHFAPPPCHDCHGDQPPNHDGTSHDEGYGDGRHPDDQFPGGPRDDMGMPPEMEAAMREVRDWCEAQMRALDDRRYADGPEGGDFDAWDDEARAIEDECRDKMHAIMEEMAHHMDDFDGFGAFTMTPNGDTIDVAGVHLWFTGEPERGRIRDFACNGAPFLEAITPRDPITDVRPDDDHALAFYTDSQDRPLLIAHDDATCTLILDPADGGAKVTFSTRFTCSNDGGAAICMGPDGEAIVRHRGEGASLIDERTMLIQGPTEILLAGDLEQDDDYDGHAAVRIRDGEVEAQSVTLGDMEMTIEADHGQEGAIKVHLDKDSHTGSFVVLKVDDDVFPTCDVAARGYDTTDGRIDLDMRPATSLDDALDADYEGDYGKYYSVSDGEGCQLILTFGHYSTKEVVLYSTASVGSSVVGIPGPSIVVLVSGIAMVALSLRGRRR